MMISGQGFFELEACSSTTEAVRRRMAVTAVFAFDHPGPDVDPTYKDRQHYKIEIMWTLNQDTSMDDIDEEHPVWYPGTMNTRFQIPEDRFRLLFAEATLCFAFHNTFSITASSAKLLN
ncbi:hypothetical protein NEUTE1DRAFT_101299 [Neurospora tetrasperma FGSC 2508]|uniref:Uncharacterized protein n=1 Tax=Neurospora tetrasperma (strain FGSC 2508 / ATCC MYA-4615 / P0657) TaxID=510951 RepID=F8MLW1_NEUT8|nr:uncharacterized protein NEUTE1DRAFT_101299 [Neurospora tetrasperma FGSC 2508]EGO58476.1 hypothetical protein NEUTE1DRAFT_101299 [Neurospora tetrasperma FGSC 2508]